MTELRKQFKIDRPETVGETDQAFDNSNYIDWLEAEIESLKQRQSLPIDIINGPLLSDIRDEMDADMEDSGMKQGEIESCLNHWGNKYLIIKKNCFYNGH